MLCYKEGKPTLISEDEIMKHMKLTSEQMKTILRLFETRDFIKIIKQDGQTFYKYTNIY